MASTIKIKRSGVSGKQPNTASLSVGELAINYKDQKLYSSNGTAVFEIGAGAGGGSTSQYLQVSNANATFATKAYAAANSYVKSTLANTNSYIASRASWVSLTGTNTALRTLISDRLQVANASTLYATKSNPATTGLLAHTGRATISTNLTVSGNVSVTGTSTFTGAATFNGAITLGDAATDLLTVNGRASIGQNLSIAGNTTFSGTAKRITGDFSNATVTNRVMFQSSTTNGTTRIEAIPNGTATSAIFSVYNNSDPTNAAAARMVVNSAEARFDSIITGTGTYLPMTFQTGGSERMRIHSYGLANVAQSMVIGKNLYVAGNTILGNPAVVTDRTVINGVTVANGQLTVSGNTVLSGTLVANSTAGVSGYYLRTSGTGVYWSPVSGGGGSVSITTTAVKNLTQNDTVVTNVTSYANSVVDNSMLATKASWTSLTTTNTALRTLISDRLQVANASAIYQTKAVERAALANTNASIATQATRITLVNTNLTGTNTALRTLINARLQVSNASTLYATKSNPATSGLLAHTGRATISTNLAVTGNTAFSGLVSIAHTGSANSSLAIRGTNTRGGVGFHDFLVVRNGGGGTNPNKHFRLNSTGGFEIVNDAYSATIFTVTNAGDVTAAGNVTAYSDENLKTNVSTINNALALIEQMRGVRYKRIEDGKAGVGVIAQEMQKVLPEVIHEGDHLSVAYGNLVGVLIEAVKELSARVKELEAK